jgi:hypothetical protein
MKIAHLTKLFKKSVRAVTFSAIRYRKLVPNHYRHYIISAIQYCVLSAKSVYYRRKQRNTPTEYHWDSDMQSVLE